MAKKKAAKGRKKPNRVGSKLNGAKKRKPKRKIIRLDPADLEEFKARYLAKERARVTHAMVAQSYTAFVDKVREHYGIESQNYHVSLEDGEVTEVQDGA